MLGPLVVRRGEAVVELPASRKVRALLAYLAMAPGAVARSPLSEMLWDMPNDPRGELRWCLSKLRGVLDGDGQARVQTPEDGVRIDLSGCDVDALHVLRAAEEGYGALPLARLRELDALFRGDFLEGLEIERSPSFDAWLIAQRRRFRSCRAAILEHIVKQVSGDEALAPLERWLALSPFDLQVHNAMLKALARSGRMREGEEHLASAVRLFESEGLDVGPLHHAWRAARGGVTQATHLVAPSPVITVPQSTEASAAPAAQGRASIAIMPFADLTGGDRRGGAADALAHDIITRLAKLRTLFVIAHGTVFALHERGIGAEEAGRMLNVGYVVCGSVRAQPGRLSVSVELIETRSARIVWSEVFNVKSDDAFAVLQEVGDRIVASIASEIEILERNRAMLKPPSSLDAWEAYHRGLWHMYQYRQADNVKAREFFQRALVQDPTFSRAHAGLSFTHFQDAFQNWAPRESAIESAYRTASEGLMADERDPASHWALGRALWLRASHAESIVELARSIELSPNFALGHYNLSFVNSIVGDARSAVESSDYSRHLSPFDPMLFGMYGTRAMALARLGRYDEAADSALKAAGRPNAFPHIHALAGCCLALTSRLEEGRAQLAAARRLVPDYDLADLLSAFPFEGADRETFLRAAKAVGLSR